MPQLSLGPVGLLSGHHATPESTGAAPLDLRRMMLVGQPLSSDSIVFGLMVQSCMTPDGWRDYSGPDADRAVLECLFGESGGMDSFVGELRKREDGSDQVVDAYNQEVEECGR